MKIETVPRLEPLPTAFAATVTALHRVAAEVVSPARKPDYAFGAAVLHELCASAAAWLWPEHFDLAIELDADGHRATYGFSPGDERHAEPYAYVGPWSAEVDGELWQAVGFRGAELTYAELLAAPDQRAAALEFFTTRREALG